MSEHSYLNIGPGRWQVTEVYKSTGLPVPGGFRRDHPTLPDSGNLEPKLPDSPEVPSVKTVTLNPALQNLSSKVSGLQNIKLPPIGDNLKKIQSIELKKPLPAIPGFTKPQIGGFSSKLIISVAIPKLPGLPSVPKLPGLPSVPKLPGLPSVPKLPAVPNMGNLNKMKGAISSNMKNKIADMIKSFKSTIPSVPSLPSLPSLPSVPSLPSLPSLPSVPSLPSLPSLPSVPKLPGLPSVPKLI